MKVLITCGPTREYIDDVRFISNASSGRMGGALAKAALADGHKVKVISGPVEISFPKGVEVIPVTSALDMKKAALDNFSWADVAICAAAVSDWRPRRIHRGKLKKSAGAPKIDFVKNPDILKELGRKKTKKQVLVGFALESENVIENAKLKLKRKNADLFIANGPEAISAKKSTAQIIDTDGNVENVGPATKGTIAKKIIETAVKISKGGKR